MPPSPGISDLRALAETAFSPEPPKRPLVGLALIVISGFLAQSVVPKVPAEAWLAAGWIILAMALMPRLRSIRTFLLFALSFLCAAAYGSLTRAPLGDDWIANRMRRSAEHLVVVGIIADDPIREEGRRPGQWLWRFSLDLEKDGRTAALRRSRGRVEVRLETQRMEISPRYGERWELAGVLRREAPGLVSPPRLRMKTDDRASKRLAAASTWDWRGAGFRARRALSERFGIGPDAHSDAVALVRALTIGERHELPPRVLEVFAKTGTLHIIAISGAHVGMISLLLLTAVRATGLSRPRWVWAMGPALAFYATMTGLAPSVVRATVMALILFLADAIRRPSDPQSALAAAALGLLAVDPTQLERPGFVLSFAAAAGLILLAPPVRNALLNRVGAPDPMALEGRSRALEWVRHAIIDLVAVTFTAWLVTAPITAHWFHLVSPVGLLVNLAVLPLAFLVLFSASCSVLFGGMAQGILEVFNFAAAFFAGLIIRVVENSLAIPGAYLRVESPGPWLTALIPVLAVMAIRGRRVARAIAFGAFALMVAMVGWRSTTRFEIAVRNLGPAMPAVVSAPGGDWLVDPGPAFAAPRILRFLHERGVDRLRAVMITRATMEAGGALPEIVSSIPTDSVWIPAVPSRSRVFAQLVENLAASGVEVVRLSRGMRFEEGGAHWEVMHPPPGVWAPNAIAGGLVVRVSRGPRAAVFSPGANLHLDRSLAEAQIDLGAHVLIEGGMTTQPSASQLRGSADVTIRAERRGEAWREPASTPSEFVVAPGETLILSAAKTGFSLRGEAPEQGRD